MNFREYKYLILADSYRITGSISFVRLLRQLILGESYKYVFWMRTCSYLRSKPCIVWPLYLLARIIFRRQRFKFGIAIPDTSQIGSGFYIGHFGGIIVNENCKIGKNCNISQGVTLGQINRGIRKGYPTVGDDVYIGPGAKIVGAVIIGNNVAIGANCVVTRDVPDNSVVVGIPGRVISNDGSQGYVNKTDYDNFI